MVYKVGISEDWGDMLVSKEQFLARGNEVSVVILVSIKRIRKLYQKRGLQRHRAAAPAAF